MPSPRTTLEICADGLESALAARAGGADRIELCSVLRVGGVTPGPGTLREVRARVDLPLVVLARPRPGDFLYTRAELAALEGDVHAARAAGAEAVALGALHEDGTVDRETTARLADLARPLEVVFHRAFDLTPDLEESLEVLVELGLDRVLTSGGAPDVGAGLPVLRALVARAGDRITVLPGGGVLAAGAARVVRESGATEVHLSAAAPHGSAAALPGEPEATRTDPDLVRATRRALDAPGPEQRGPLAGGAPAC